jgi:hypothetical protein
MANKKQVKLLIEMFKRIRKEKRTKEESLQILMRAGILDEHGNHTEPYKILGAAVKKIEQPNV